VVPGGLLSRVRTGTDLLGSASADYHLGAGESVRDAASRAWSYLQGTWASFRAALAGSPETDRATTLTRERWSLVLLRELGFGRVPTVPTGGLLVDDKAFGVSHLWEHVPLHLLGWRVELDRRSPGVAGAAQSSPQSMVQELLNRSDDHLWAVLCNGRVLRLLRDSRSLVGSSYVEFDLDTMFDGELFADFLVLFRLAHQSRFETLDDAGLPAQCWLERWRVTALDQGSRALDQLRTGVVTAIDRLGSGFVRHPANGQLRADLASGELALDDFRHTLLRGVYRLLFLCVAEDRGLLLSPTADAAARDRYLQYFSTARLRRLARRRLGTRHQDLWRSLAVVLDGLSSEDGRPELGLVGLGGLFDPTGGANAGESTDLLTSWELSNDALLDAVRALSILPPAKGRPRPEPVDYRNLDAEELGSIYESLLEYIPRHDAAAQQFSLVRLAGNEKKTTGSYYTPSSLIEVLLESALDPVLDEAQQQADPRAGLLAVTVCDPACGSGHFLVAAARRIAKRVAALDTGDPEPGLIALRAALGEVVGRCIYGVDVNPLAAELAKVSLWLETLEPGTPLAFLDAHIKVGNSLLGASPALIAGGIPSDAFKPITGDDRKLAAALVKRNTAEHAGQRGIFDEDGLHLGNGELAAAVAAVSVPAASLADVHRTAARYRRVIDSPTSRRARGVADAWCAAFLWRKIVSASPPVTQRVLPLFDREGHPGVDTATVAEVDRLGSEYRFFHWYLEFPEIFAVPETGLADGVTPGWTGGFSCVLTNPPWERLKLQEQEFFAALDPHVATAPNAAERRRRIAALEADHPGLYAAFTEAKRRAEGESHWLRTSGRYPLTGRGDINTYAVFAETARTLIGPCGRMGVIVPTGIATDATTQYFFRDVVESSSLGALYDFENARPLFEGVHRSFKFALLTLTGTLVREEAADFAFFVHDPVELATPGVRFALKPDEITLLNPNTGTSPIFRSRRDAEITLGIYRRVPILVKTGDAHGNPWGISFMRMFDMSNDSGLFRTREYLEAEGYTLDGNVYERGNERYLPLYEAKMIHQYDHRWASYDPDGAIFDVPAVDKLNARYTVMPRYWVDQFDVAFQAESVLDRGWFIGCRLIGRATDERSVVAGAYPASAVGNSLGIFSTTARSDPVLVANFSALVLDYVARQKLGGINLNLFVTQQLPFLTPISYREPTPWCPALRLDDWINNRIDELIWTAWDAQSIADELGDDGPPFVWDEGRRQLIQAELDATFFRLYGLERDEVEHVLGSFPILRRKDEAKFGEYRTARLILEIHDAMASAIATGVPYQTTLDPPPGEGPRHPDRERVA